MSMPLKERENEHMSDPLLSVIVLLAVFGGDLLGPSGFVASPLYPRHYPNDATYTWTVTGSQVSRLMVNFQMLDVEGPWRGNCVYDYVKVALFTFYFTTHQ